MQDSTWPAKIDLENIKGGGFFWRGGLWELEVAMLKKQQE
jgi:hypothetical protein